MKLKIAICDDDDKFIDTLIKQIDDYFSIPAEEDRISCFTNGEELVRLDTEQWDIIFMDIDMQGITGLEIAQRIQFYHKDTSVIFVSDHDDEVYHAIKYQPLRFVRKTRIKEELDEALDAAIRKVEREQNFFELNTCEGDMQFAEKEILYFESDRHYVFIHGINHRYKLRAKIAELEPIFAACGFVRTHISYLVNMRYIDQIKIDHINLDNGKVLPVSRRYAATIKQKYLEYIRR